MDSNTATIWLSCFASSQFPLSFLTDNGFKNVFISDFTYNYNFIQNKKIIVAFCKHTCDKELLDKSFNRLGIFFSSFERDEEYCIVVSVPEDAFDDYDQIVLGKYSKISDYYINVHQRGDKFREGIIKKTQKGKERMTYHYSLPLDEDYEEYWSKPSHKCFLF